MTIRRILLGVLTAALVAGPLGTTAAHASFAAWTLPWGFLLRNSFTKLVLPWSLVAVAMRGSP